MGIKETRPGVWRVDVSVMSRKRQYRERADVTGRKRDAEARLAEIRAALRRRADEDDGSLTINTFADALQFYLSTHDVGKSASYFRRLSKDLGHVRISELAGAFEVWRSIIRRAPVARTGRPPKNGTVNRFTVWAKVVLNYAAAFKKIRENPLAHFTRKTGMMLAEEPRDRYLSQEERGRLLQAIERHAPHIGPIVTYMLAVPCRSGELASLPKTAYNSFTNTVYIPDSKAGIPINKPVPDEMRSYFLSIPADCPYLFYRHDRNGFHPIGDFKRAWKTVLRLAGLQNVRVHDLRHCAATDLYRAGNPERRIMDIAGWKTPMLSTYRHVDSLESARKTVFLTDFCDKTVTKNGQNAAAMFASV